MEKQRNNIIIFAVIAALSGWLGLLIDQLVPATEASGESEGSLGTLVWLILPLGTALFMRKFRGDGWQDFGLKLNLRKSWKWYLLSLLFPVLLISAILLVGGSLGNITFENFAISVFIPAFIAAFIADFVKNIFEEFAWRGYLTPRLNSLGVSRFKNHLITGLVWASWHFTYWLFLIPDETFAQFTSHARLPFIFLATIAVVINAFVYGEIRLRSKSVWPLMLLHSTINGFAMALLTEGLITIATNRAIFNLGAEGYLMMAGFAVVGFVLYRKPLPKLAARPAR